MADHFKLGTKPGTEQRPELREQDVIAYLRRNPRVLLNNPDLLAAISPERTFETESVVVDMQRFVVDRLRRQLDELKNSSESLVNTTRANMSLVERAMECTLALLYARDFTELNEILRDELPLHLGVDAVSIAFETEALPADAGHAVRALNAGAVETLMQSQAGRVRPEVDGETSLYGAAAGLIRSDALIRLEAGEGLPEGVFAVGCRTPGYFDVDQGTELIAFLGHVTRYAVGRWWTLQL
ncbi:MAG: DUF484 family protein [Rhodospirillaceae bacterium]|nr:DUF484 family protein [Rhodospirillaceae bacterium]